MTAATRFVPAWVDEYVPLDAIHKHQPFQVRTRLDARAVKQYRAMSQAGSAAPPIKLGLIGTTYYLLDGWHRMEAGAFVRAGDSVLALVAPMTHKQAQWVAADANRIHGVKLKGSELRAVFRAFIKSGQHKKAKGELMSYREMGAELGRPHTTIRNWVRDDFPRLFESLGSEGIGNLSPGVPPVAVRTLDEERIDQAHEAARTLWQIGDVLDTADARGELMLILRKTIQTLEASGKPIAYSDF
jgi:hypothetical protein